MCWEEVFVSSCRMASDATYLQAQRRLLFLRVELLLLPRIQNHTISHRGISHEFSSCRLQFSGLASSPFQIHCSKTKRKYCGHTNFPSALYGEKCSESVMPVSLVPFPFVSAMFVNVFNVLLRQFVINRDQREKKRTRATARLQNITSCHRID